MIVYNQVRLPFSSHLQSPQEQTTEGTIQTLKFACFTTHSTGSQAIKETISKHRIENYQKGNTDRSLKINNWKAN